MFVNIKNILLYRIGQKTELQTPVDIFTKYWRILQILSLFDPANNFVI